MDHAKAIGKQRQRRRYRVRKHTRGTAERPRLCVTRSHRNIMAQVVDDLSGKTLASASTADKNLAKKVKYGGNVTAAEAIGKVRCRTRRQSGHQSSEFRPWPVQIPWSRGCVGRSGPGRRSQVLRMFF